MTGHLLTGHRVAALPVLSGALRAMGLDALAAGACCAAHFVGKVFSLQTGSLTSCSCGRRALSHIGRMRWNVEREANSQATRL